jgi:ribonucleoside-diphosphate reductase alpha chain
MSLAEAHHTASLPPPTVGANNDAASGPEYRVIRRNGSVTAFDPSKIAVALTKAFLVVIAAPAPANRIASADLSIRSNARVQMSKH